MYSLVTTGLASSKRVFSPLQKYVYSILLVSDLSTGNSFLDEKLNEMALYLLHI
jgi:hypothetical protein